MSTSRLTPILLAGALLAAGPLTAQGQVRIHGRVIDDATLAPIPGAEVRIYRASLQWRVVDRTFANEDGRFTFEVKEHPGYIFRASSIGYTSAETPVLWIDDYLSYEIEIRLDADAVLLAPIEVVARSRIRDNAVVESFFERVDQGFGHYFTYMDVERVKPRQVSDLIARVPGVRLTSSGAGLRRVVSFSRGTRSCAATIFVDGMLWTRPDDRGAIYVDDVVTPDAVLGIEVYPGTATIPAEFLTPQSQCGVVAIWTRRQ